ncbi:MAG TPA: phytoene/squalene synthase family protein [Bradyrhizobium sp.]|uniref:phytoene/squalene synthase family protein n=1 Tax=Bradyrhizobium sp. TaxID=376 RepID=UPI002CCC21D8|nr:phytoene/squalene synthase family protein [Bradyrhizobium sp.]HLZ02256.1 phytoene/squalene synthase family protein [Bradyrhizobium sp.]
MSRDGDAASFCADLVRDHDFVRYASTLFVPPAERRALLALYAFNVEIIRIRDQVTQPLPGEIRMQWWTDLLAGAAHGGEEGNPVAAELLLVLRAYGLPAEPLSALIGEHEFDLYNDPMPTLAALEGYVHETTSALFALAARLLSPPSAEIDHLARHAGFAFGFVQVVASLPRDAARRQLFLPLQFLQGHGSGSEEVFAGRQTPKVRAAIDQLLREARRHLQTAEGLLAEVSPSVRPVFLPLALVRRDLARLTRADNDPFVERIRSRFSVLWTLWRAARSKQFRAA